MEAFVGMARSWSGGTGETGGSGAVGESGSGTGGSEALQAALDSVAIGIAAELAIAEGRVIELSDLFATSKA
jgi:hypothetical protein